MHPQIEALFDEVENHYLKPEELKLLSQYVESLPSRLETYRAVRDQELEIMQWVADQLQAQLSQEPQDQLERSVKHALILLRHCNMAMLQNDARLVEHRCLDWLRQSIQVYKLEKIESVLYQLLDQRLSQVLTGKQLSLLNPILKSMQTALLGQTKAQSESQNGVAIGW